MQKWEYMTILRQRGWHYEKKSQWADANDWNRDISEMLKTCGQEGWELVTVEPRSDYLAGHWSTGGATSISDDFAGFTSSDVWIFKRPIE